MASQLGNLRHPRVEPTERSTESARGATRTGAGFHRLSIRVLWLFVLLLPLDTLIQGEAVQALLRLGSIARLAGYVAFGFGLLDTVRRGVVRRLRAPQAIAYVTFVWFTSSYFWSIDKAATLSSLVTAWQLFLMMYVIYQVVETEREHESLLVAFVIGCTVLCIATISAFVVGRLSHTGIYDRYSAAFYNENRLALTVAMAIPVTWYLSQSARKTLWRWAYRLVVPAAVFAIVLTASRGGFITLLIALSYLFVSGRDRTGRTKVATQVLIAVLVLIAALLHVQTFVPKSTLERLATIPQELRGGSMSQRRVVWSAGLVVAQNHPWIGVGLGAFIPAIAPISATVTAAHSAYLAVLVESGIIGLGLFMAVFLSTGRLVLRLERRERDMWLVVLLTLAVGVAALSWQTHKQLWLVPAMIAARMAVQDSASAQPDTRSRPEEKRPI